MSFGENLSNIPSEALALRFEAERNGGASTLRAPDSAYDGTLDGYRRFIGEHSEAIGMLLDTVAADVWEHMTPDQASLTMSYLETAFLSLCTYADHLEKPPGTEERLRMTIPELLEDIETRTDLPLPGTDNLRLRVTNILDREGKPQLRELLLRGYENVKDIRNLGSKGLDVLDAVRQAVIPHIEWPAQLDGSNAVRFYSSLDDIPARAIDPLLARFFTSSAASPTSVAELLAVSDTDLYNYLATMRSHADPKQRTEAAISTDVQMLRQKTHGFVTAYEQAATRRKV